MDATLTLPSARLQNKYLVGTTMCPCPVVELKDLLGRFKTLSLWLLKWFYYNLWRELCFFVTFYKSVTDRPTDGHSLLEMRGRIYKWHRIWEIARILARHGLKKGKKSVKIMGSKANIWSKEKVFLVFMLGHGEEKNHSDKFGIRNDARISNYAKGWKVPFFEVF